VFLIENIAFSHTSSWGEYVERLFLFTDAYAFSSDFNVPRSFLLDTDPCA
jgi:hypothetical protein